MSGQAAVIDPLHVYLKPASTHQRQGVARKYSHDVEGAYRDEIDEPPLHLGIPLRVVAVRPGGQGENSVRTG